MIKTKWWAILIIIFSTVITSTASLFLKIGMNKFVLELFSILTNYPLLLGMFLYGIGAGLLIFAFRHGELSVLFPFYSLSFVWVIIFSSVFLNEIINIYKIIGVVGIIIGIILIGLGSKEKKRITLK
ncbi:EamA family transporter [Candidatus Woesearchaeota archaeon]|jgi:drug/metabolite transporter (DMT)-like permease|nr:EamA family transporter [Candidatus Woesearchaeota archaeon]MBT6519470.1 EamA family transporter [Candidatus Woesearchaeota archaeon]MBT7368218.1 EamA family transporter [Candidatus Woesearchaeota archaeon]